MSVYFLEELAGTSYKPIFAYNLNDSTPGIGKMAHDKFMVAFSAMMGLSISNKTCPSPCSTTFVKSRSKIGLSKGSLQKNLGVLSHFWRFRGFTKISHPDNRGVWGFEKAPKLIT